MNRSDPKPHVRALIKRLEGLVRSQRSHQTLEEFVNLGYCAVAKLSNPERGDALEAEYMKIVGRRTPEEVRGYAEAMRMFQVAMLETDGREDILGAVAGEMGFLSGHLGQFFTPMDISRMMVRVSISDVAEKVKRGDIPFMTMLEPACGAGGMILAVHEYCREQDIPAFYTGVELNRETARMAFLQVTLSGAPGLIYCGNSLTREEFERSKTMTASVFTLWHGPIQRSKMPSAADYKGQGVLFDA